jgi:hypothetical protein
MQAKQACVHVLQQGLAETCVLPCNSCQRSLLSMSINPGKPCCCMAAGEAYCWEYPSAPTCRPPLMWRLRLIATCDIAKYCYIAVAAWLALAGAFWVYKYRRRRLIRHLQQRYAMLQQRLSRRRSAARQS